MLAAHMDQIGFLVRHIDEPGYLRLNPVGGFRCTKSVCTQSPCLYFARRFAGHHECIRQADSYCERHREKEDPRSDGILRRSRPEGDQVRSKVLIGDMVVLDGPFEEVGNSVVSQCLDNRVGCWAQLKALEALKHHNCEIHAVWTVQEEVGLRGAQTAAFGVDPDIGVACDTTLCCKTPGVPDEDRVSVAGDGVCLHVMDSSMISDIGLVEQFEAVAKANSIKCQRAILPRGGQDGAMIQRSRSGVKTIALACPVKYIHTVTEMTHKDDLKSYHTLLTAWLQQL